jgi:ABC-type lipoprotein release transport system permease subunit
MKMFNLIVRNLWYYRKHYLAVLAGVTVSTAALTGALSVGDSVRGSLDMLTGYRLGNIRLALHSENHYFRAALANEIYNKTGKTVIPALQLGGIGINPQTGKRVRDIRVTGIDSLFVTCWNQSPESPGEDQVIISQNLAAKLGLTIGDPLLIRIPGAGKAPRDAPFVAGEDPSVSLRLTVTAIAQEHGLGRFSLKSDQKSPYNVFIPLKQLSRQVDLPGLANLLLVPGNGDHQPTGIILDSSLADVWQLPDAGLDISGLDAEGMYQITTGRIFFDDSTTAEISKILPGAGRIFTYLANNLTVHDKNSPYSFVAAVDKGILKDSPVPGGIIITDWLADDLAARPGDSLVFTYYVIGPLKRLTERQAAFLITSVIPLRAVPSGIRMMPGFPGMNNAGNCKEWETGVPIDLDRIRDKDEDYWNVYRGTPKAFISMEDGQRIWDNPFGTVTAFRFSALPEELPAIEKEIMTRLDPAWRGMTFKPVYEAGKQAATQGTDFGGLFLSLSFFLIVAALLLTALLFSLNTGIRFSEAGVLSAIGFRKRSVMRMFFIEAMIVTGAGAVTGALAGILYNQLLVLGLNTLWQDAVHTSMLRPVIRLSTLITGAGAGFLVAAAVLFITLNRRLRKPVSLVVKGVEYRPLSGWWGRRASYIIPGTTLVLLALSMAVFMLTGTAFTEAGFFLVAGGIMLCGLLCLVYALLISRRKSSIKIIPGFFRTVVNNIILNRKRNMASITLLALGTFTVIITGANRKTFYGAETDRRSGTGGFLLWTETTMPLLYDLNQPAGKTWYGLQDEPMLQDCRFYQLHRLDGNDASCLNLNQVPQPMILGVPAGEFDRLEAFQLVNALPEVDPDHPWQILETECSSGVIPAFADQTVITWGLQKKVGDTLLYRDEAGRELRVKLTGGLNNSVFQGHILASESLLKRYFPSLSGSRVMLVDGPSGHSGKVALRLEELLVDYGMTATLTTERLAEFNSVQNTYLSIFMILGALAILIGTVGLGVVLWRNCLERKQELALYLSTGFPRKFILNMLLAEHLLILGTGIVTGIAAAVTGILPSLASPSFSIPGMFLLVLVLIILVNGFLWIYFPARRFLQKDIIPALRNE